MKREYFYMGAAVGKHASHASVNWPTVRKEKGMEIIRNLFIVSDSKT